MSAKGISNTQRLPFARDNRQRLSAATWNRAATIINERVLNAPKDLDSGAETGIDPRIWHEQERTMSLVRVTNPDDAEQWVDVNRIDTVSMIDSETGRVTWLSFTNPTTE